MYVSIFNELIVAFLYIFHNSKGLYTHNIKFNKLNGNYMEQQSGPQ